MRMIPTLTEKMHPAYQDEVETRLLASSSATGMLRSTASQKAFRSSTLEAMDQSQATGFTIPMPTRREDLRKRQNFYYQTLNNAYVRYAPSAAPVHGSSVGSQLYSIFPMRKETQKLVEKASIHLKATPLPPPKKKPVPVVIKRTNHLLHLDPAEMVHS